MNESGITVGIITPISQTLLIQDLHTEEFYLSHFLANLPDEFETVLEIIANDKETTTINDALPKIIGEVQ
jgi:hypothetical protein